MTCCIATMQPTVFEVCMSPDDRLEARAPLPQRLKVYDGHIQIQLKGSSYVIIPTLLHAQKLESAPAVTAEMLEMKQLKVAERKKEVSQTLHSRYWLFSTHHFSSILSLYIPHPSGVRKEVCPITHVSKRQTSKGDPGSERVTEQRRGNSNDRELRLL